MSAAEPLARRVLHAAWRRSLARVASLELAPPAPMPLGTSGASLPAYLWAAIRAAAPKSTACMALAIFATACCHVALSFVLGRLTDRAVANQREGVVAMLAVLLGLWLAAPLFGVLHSLARLFASQNLRIAVTDHLAARLMYARPRELAGASVGNLVERIELAAGNLPAVVGSLAETVVKLVSVAVLSSLLLLEVSPPLALLAAAWMGTAVALSAYLARSGMQIVEDASDAHARVIADLTELVSNVPLVRGFAAQRAERSRFGKALGADLLACRRVRSYWLFVLLIEVAYKWLFGIAILAASFVLYDRGELGLAQLVTVGSLVISLSWHFETVAFHFVDLFDALGILRASLRELDAVPIELPADGAEGGAAPSLPAPGRVVLRGVTARHGETVALREVSLELSPGEKVGLVGPSGSGKSSLLAVLRGELPAEAGAVLVHGLPLSSEPGGGSTGWLSRASSEALHSAQVFHRSVRENVSYGMPEAGEAELDRALAAAQARTLVDELPQGKETVIGERGANLSTGERQRLAIARALLKRAPLLVLDEATSSVDQISERRILEHVLQLPDCTVLAVTHRVATLAGFDRVVLLDEGRIADTGTHAELLARSALYRQLQLTAATGAEMATTSASAAAASTATAEPSSEPRQAS